MQGNENLECLDQPGLWINLKPLQIAAHFGCSESLASMLQYLLGIYQKDKSRDKIMSLVHGKAANNKPLMLTIMGNRKYFASHSLFLQIERYIHQDSSLNVQRCILNQLGSGPISQEIINQVKKMDQKNIDCLGKTKVFFRIFLCLLPLAVLPIGFDVGTDTACTFNLFKELRCFAICWNN